jgi:hypothetical protein
MILNAATTAAESSAAQSLGFLRMSAANARTFLTDLRNGRFPIIAMGDEDGTVQIEFEIAETGLVLSVHNPSEPHASRRLVIEQSFDIKSIANDLLTDLAL